MKSKSTQIKDYDEQDTTSWINPKKRLSLANLGLKLPPHSPTQVISIRLPTLLLNEIRAEASAKDIPYQSLIKLYLSKSVKRKAA